MVVNYDILVIIYMKQELSKVKEPKRFDFILIAVVALLTISSLIAIYSSLKLIPAYQSNIVTTQIEWLVICCAAVIVIMYFGNESLYDFIQIVYWILLVMLIVLFLDRILYNFTGSHFPGGLIREINGAISWFTIPGVGNLQPSEFMKIVLVIKTALIIDEHNQNKIENSFEEDISLFKKVLKPAIVPLLLILIQPDTGIFLIIFVAIVFMILCSGIRKEWFIVGASIAIAAVLIFLYLYFYQCPLLESLLGYKLNRIDGWFYPEETYLNQGHQLYTALLALGSAGFSGVGLQPHTIAISEANTDLIFVVFGQTFGWIGSMFLLVLCFALDFRIYRILTTTKNMNEKYMLIGFLGMIVFQQIQNIGMVIGLLPITGITLPFISYGGSSLLSYFIALGFILNASAKAKKLSDYVYE